MSVILHCGKCQKRMGALEPHAVVDDLYLCKKCADELTKSKKEEQDVKDFYDGLDIGDLPYVGYWKKEAYRIFLKNGFKFVNTVPIISFPSGSYADQFENHTYIILAYDNHWSIFDKQATKVLEVMPSSFNAFDAYNITYIETLITSYI